jgi:hypothetical protein
VIYKFLLQPFKKISSNINSKFHASTKSSSGKPEQWPTVIYFYFWSNDLKVVFVCLGNRKSHKLPRIENTHVWGQHLIFLNKTIFNNSFFMYRSVVKQETQVFYSSRMIFFSGVLEKTFLLYLDMTERL